MALFAMQETADGPVRGLPRFRLPGYRCAFRMELLVGIFSKAAPT